MDSADGPGLLRIGELSRRVGVSDHVLRAWENRYGLLSPVRSAGGFRLYSENDERRVRRMQAELANGLSAAQAARVALAGELPVGVADRAVHEVPPVDGAAAAFGVALDAMDEPGAQGALDQLLNEFTVETVLRDVVIPYLHDLGERVAQGVVGIGQEHFASHVIRGRLAGLARGWGGGRGPHAVLACPPEEHHDLALMVFGIVLARNGWRIGYLGANTPIADVLRIAEDSATRTGRPRRHRPRTPHADRRRAAPTRVGRTTRAGRGRCEPGDRRRDRSLAARRRSGQRGAPSDARL